MAAGEIDYLVNFHPRQICQIVYDHWQQNCGCEGLLTPWTVFQATARNFTIRLAEALKKYLCSLMRRAETLATPETECLLYATYWFRPILSELIGAATESAAVNRDRAPSGPVKVVVTNQPHSRPNAEIDLARLWSVCPSSMVTGQLGE